MLRKSAANGFRGDAEVGVKNVLDESAAEFVGDFGLFAEEGLGSGLRCSGPFEHAIEQIFGCGQFVVGKDADEPGVVFERGELLAADFDAMSLKSGIEDGDAIVGVAGVSGLGVGEAEFFAELAHEVECHGVGQRFFGGVNGGVIREAADTAKVRAAENIERGRDAAFRDGRTSETANTGKDEAPAFGVDHPPALAEFLDAEKARGALFIRCEAAVSSERGTIERFHVSKTREGASLASLEGLALGRTGVDPAVFGLRVKKRGAESEEDESNEFWRAHGEAEEEK